MFRLYLWQILVCIALFFITNLVQVESLKTKPRGMCVLLRLYCQILSVSSRLIRSTGFPPVILIYCIAPQPSNSFLCCFKVMVIIFFGILKFWFICNSARVHFSFLLFLVLVLVLLSPHSPEGRPVIFDVSHLAGISGRSV